MRRERVPSWSTNVPAALARIGRRSSGHLGFVQMRSDVVERFAWHRDELWERIAQVDQYATWWPWLREFDGERLAAGEVWRCVVRPPAPYTVRFEIAIERAEAPASVSARVTGDIVGDASLTLDDVGTGSRLRLVSELAPASRAMRTLTRVAFPLARRSHDAILAAGVRQFRERSGGVRPAR